MEYLDGNTDGSLPKIHFSFEKESLFQTTLFAVTVIISPPEKHPEYISVWQAPRRSTPEAGGQAAPWEREQSASPTKGEQEALELHFLMSYFWNLNHLGFQLQYLVFDF